MDVEQGIPGKVTIEPEVLETIARLTARGVPGVHGLVDRADIDRFLGLGEKSVEVQVRGDQVSVELHIVAKPDMSLLKLGRAVQHEVTRAIQKMIGMPVEMVNVYIEDVVYPDTAEKALAV